MELKVGQTITCKKERIVYGKVCLTIGKNYKITYIDEDYVTIIDDDGDSHEFSFIETSVNYVGKYFTTEPPKKERYFIVFYFFVDKAKNGHGFCGIVTNDGGYLNRDETLKEIKEQNEQAVLTNIIELNQQDYESWNK